MQSYIHTIKGHTVRLFVYEIGTVEAWDVWGLCPRRYPDGAYRVEAVVDDKPRGQAFFPYGLASYPLADDAREAARLALGW